MTRSDDSNRDNPESHSDPTRNTASKPMMKVRDATYGSLPQGSFYQSLERAERWFLLDANRWLVTFLLLGGVFVTIVGVGVLGPVSVHSFLTEGISPATVLTELLKTIVSVVVIVLSINQLVLSPGLGPVSNQETRFSDALDLRKQVENYTDCRVSPSSPSRFFRVLMTAILEQTDRIRAITATEPRADAETLHAEIETYAEALETEGAYVRQEMTRARLGEFEVIPAVMRFAISEKVRSLRELRENHTDALSDPQRTTLDEMEELLELFTVSREYIKTIYIRSEYINLSQGLLYIGLPALIITYCSVQIYTPTVFPAATLGISNQLLFVAFAGTVAVSPFTLLIAYICRLAVLSRSTLFIGPFAAGPEDHDRSGE